MKLSKKMIGALLLAHHPICHPFARDLLGKKHPLCKGCVFFYSFLFIGLGIGFGLYQLTWFKQTLWATAGLTVIGLILISSYGIKLIMNKKSKLTQLRLINQKIDNLIHFSAGIGVGFVYISLFHAPIALILKILLVIQLQLSFALTFLPRWRKMDEICEKCPFKNQKPDCPGFTQTSL
ncbi:MAG: hypothetical protein K9W44_14240 [Candidatus Lokiarchaeota archaeon]|nr:hypothetical protein [Candidatus Harpocratesius repetitus]